MEEKLKLHELSVSKVGNKDLLWLVAVKNTYDYRSFFDGVLINHIKEYEPQAIIKSGEIVWCIEYEGDEDSYKTRIERGNSTIHPFDNFYAVNYLTEDFRELTQEEKEEYLK